MIRIYTENLTHSFAQFFVSNNSAAMIFTEKLVIKSKRVSCDKHGQPPSRDESVKFDRERKLICPFFLGFHHFSAKKTLVD